jgi:hypothetical protein
VRELIEAMGGGPREMVGIFVATNGFTNDAKEAGEGKVLLVHETDFMNTVRSAEPPTRM